MPPETRSWLPSLAAVVVLAFLAGTASLTAQDQPAQPDTAATPIAQPSLTDPASPWVLVNKAHPLAPADYVPADLTQPNVRLAVSETLLNRTTAAAAEAMFAAAEADGVIITLVSGYRSFASQGQVHDRYVAALGQPSAESISAWPGHSEHQAGWAMDIGDGVGPCSFESCFANQPVGRWAAANAHRFGFVRRRADHRLRLRAMAPALHRHGSRHRHGRPRRWHAGGVLRDHPATVDSPARRTVRGSNLRPLAAINEHLDGDNTRLAQTYGAAADMSPPTRSFRPSVLRDARPRPELKIAAAGYGPPELSVSKSCG
ncbi:UNVERIFIED_ORG: LAS superfamily LD-carboxypeptidase LdcB [Arthrobacter sp. UYCu721]